MELSRKKQTLVLIVLVVLLLVSWSGAIFSLLNPKKIYEIASINSKKLLNQDLSSTGSKTDGANTPSNSTNKQGEKTPTTTTGKTPTTIPEIPVSGDKVTVSLGKEFTLKAGDEAQVGDNLLLRILFLVQPSSSPGTTAIIAQAESGTEAVNMGFTIGKIQDLEEKSLGYTYTLKSATSKQATFLIKKT